MDPTTSESYEYAHDDYSHPSMDIQYIIESFVGNGIEDEHSVYDRSCCCAFCDDSNDCICVSTFGANYENGLLRDEKLHGDMGVFECGFNCRCSSPCKNRVTRRGPSPHLVIKETGNKGYGVFAVKDFPRGYFICEYAGEVISKSEVEARSKVPDHSHYILTLRENCSDETIVTSVDSRLYGNIGRYLNHSCSPNCVVVPVRSGSVIPLLGIFTSQIVMAGEELTYNYAPGCTTPSTTPCQCNSPCCSGFLPHSPLMD